MFNDFTLVKLDPADVTSTNPSVPFFGGPTGVDTDGTEVGEPVYILEPAPTSNGVSDLNLALDYANAQSDLGTLDLVPGTEPFQATGAAGAGGLPLPLPLPF